MDAADVLERVWGLLGRLEGILEEHSRRQLEIRKGDERQEFLDRVALALFPLNRSCSIAYEQADRLWAERGRRRGQPSERELAVRWLHQQAKEAGGRGWKADALFSAADAIKAGKHLEPEPGCDCGATEGVPHSVDCPVVDSRWEGRNG